MLVAHEIKKIFQSERDRLRNADHPDMMRPKNNSGLGLSRIKVPVEKEKDDEGMKKKNYSST